MLQLTVSGAESAVATNPDLTYVEFADGQGFETDPADTSIAIGVAKDSELTAQFNAALAELTEDGTIQSIIDKYINTGDAAEATDGEAAAE